jgi:hypothetical protein
MINQSLLKPQSYRQMESAIVLSNGMASGYGLGVNVLGEAAHRSISHGGEISGFTSENIVFPDDRAAVAVLMNQDAVNAPGILAGRIVPLLFPKKVPDNQEDQARRIFTDFQRGKIDRSLFSENANSYFSAQALKDMSAGLRKLGAPLSVTQTAQRNRGGMTFRDFVVKLPEKTLEVWQFTLPNGKIEQFQVMATE